MAKKTIYTDVKIKYTGKIRTSKKNIVKYDQEYLRGISLATLQYAKWMVSLTWMPSVTIRLPKTLNSMLSKLESTFDRFRMKSWQLLLRSLLVSTIPYVLRLQSKVTFSDQSQSNCREFFFASFFSHDQDHWVTKKKKKTWDTQVHWENKDQ